LASYVLAGNVIDFSASIQNSFDIVDIILPLIAITTFLIQPKRAEFSKSGKICYAYTTLITFIVSVICSLSNGGFISHISRLKDQCYNATTPTVIYTPFGNLLAEALTITTPITKGEREEVTEWFEVHNRLSTLDTIYNSQTKDNLIVIFCESLESWPLQAKVEEKEITPNLNALISDSNTYYAPHVVSQAGTGRSIDGQLLMLTGMYPTQDFVYAMKYAGNRYYALPDAMRENGAKTYLLSGDKPSTWNQGSVARVFGIDSLIMQDKWDNSEKIGLHKHISDASLFRQIEQRMRNGEIWHNGEKAYVQIVTYSCHNPFKIPDKYKTLHLKEKYNKRLADYITAVHYTDNAIGGFINYLRTRPDWCHTMVVIVGDHEALASWRDDMRKDAKIGNIVSDKAEVPFIVLNARIVGQRNAIMGQADVYTTILDQFGLKYPWRGMGFSAIGNLSPCYAFDNQGNIEGITNDAYHTEMANIEKARKISDLIIRYNLLDKYQPQPNLYSANSD
jgi:phosphoglycerol transferase MdoB-like AlkP superfamily enzyme